MVIKPLSDHDEWKANEDRKAAEKEEHRRLGEKPKPGTTPIESTHETRDDENAKKWRDDLYQAE